MVTPNVKPCITNDDIEAQLEDNFTHEPARGCAPEPQRVDPNNGVLRWGFDKATFHLRCRQRFSRPVHRAVVDVPRRRRKPGYGDKWRVGVGQ
jgi:hypothetical protein